MLPEEVARRYQHSRPAFHLADYAPVGLPVYAVTIRILTLSRRPIPPIEEFALKCIASGLNSTCEISEFLGLDERVVKASLIGLAQMECIALLPLKDSRIQSLQLTRKGRLTLENAQTEEPEERELKIHYDGLLKKAAWYDRFETMRYEQLREQNSLEIHAFPPKRPQLSDLDVREIERIVRALGNPEHYKKDLLAVRHLERVQKFYLPAIALVYAANDGREVQVGFAIDGKLSRDHELAYAKMDGPKKQGIEKGVRSSFTALDAARELKQQLGIDDEQLRSKEQAVIGAKLAAEQCQATLEATNNEEVRQSLRQELNDLQEARQKAETELNAGPIRNLYTVDHPPLLQDSLTASKERLLIISPWITGAVVNSVFLSSLEKLLHRNVKVYVGYGISEQPTENPDPRDKAAKERLSSLAQRYPNFKFKRLGNTHAKVLIKDNEFAAVTSFNWLSFKGDPSRTFRDEQGILIRERTLVDQKFDELVHRFTDAQ